MKSIPVAKSCRAKAVNSNCSENWYKAWEDVKDSLMTLVVNYRFKSRFNMSKGRYDAWAKIWLDQKLNPNLTQILTKTSSKLQIIKYLFFIEILSICFFRKVSFFLISSFLVLSISFKCWSDKSVELVEEYFKKVLTGRCRRSDLIYPYNTCKSSSIFLHWQYYLLNILPIAQPKYGTFAHDLHNT